MSGGTIPPDTAGVPNTPAGTIESVGGAIPSDAAGVGNTPSAKHYILSDTTEYIFHAARWEW